MDKEIIGHGTTFERGTGSPLSYTEIARVTEISPPSLSRDPVDVTHLKSTDRWKEFIAGMRDGGEVSLTLVYNPENSTQDLLMDDFNSNDRQDYRVKFPNDQAHAWDFEGIVTAIETAVPMEDKVSQTITIKVSGKPTFENTVS